MCIQHPSLTLPLASNFYHLLSDALHLLISSHAITYCLAVRALLQYGNTAFFYAQAEGIMEAIDILQPWSYLAALGPSSSHIARSIVPNLFRWQSPREQVQCKVPIASLFILNRRIENKNVSRLCTSNLRTLLRFRRIHLQFLTSHLSDLLTCKGIYLLYLIWVRRIQERDLEIWASLV